MFNEQKPTREAIVNPYDSADNPVARTPRSRPPRVVRFSFTSLPELHLLEGTAGRSAQGGRIQASCQGFGSERDLSTRAARALDASRSSISGS